jgi:hypothetical protein
MERSEGSKTTSSELITTGKKDKGCFLLITGGFAFADQQETPDFYKARKSR